MPLRSPSLALALALPIGFLAVEVALFLLAPGISAPVAYVAMVAAPALTGAAALRRALLESPVARGAWVALALSMFIWSLGALGNLWQELVLGHVAEMYRSSMLAFNLSTVPLAFLLAAEWRSARHNYVHLFDALLALALGLAYFDMTWTAIQATAKPGEPGVDDLVWLIDAQNLYVALGASARWFVAQEREERVLFRALAVHAAGFFALICLNDHVFAGDASFGPEWGTVITPAFALLAYFALDKNIRIGEVGASPYVVRLMSAARPIVLACALLIVSLFLIRFDYRLGCAGVLIAVLGYGARSTLVHVRNEAHNASLARRQSELQLAALTDALTGLANRHYLDRVLRHGLHDAPETGRSLSVLMIDIDHFKQFNDRYGHTAGDACLRTVARTMQMNLARPEDVVIRYGGEEFIALLVGADLDGAQAVAERLRAAVQKQAVENLGSPTGRVTISVGVASAITERGVIPDGLIECADRALYHAKSTGRDRVCVHTLDLSQSAE